MMYKADHIKVLKILSSALPKKLTFKTKDIVEKAFKRYDDGDRRVRNAYRKLRAEGHIEIIGRGEYRLTVLGAALCRRLKKNGWDASSESKKIRKKKKATKKRVAKKDASSGAALSF
jgi:predicted transcriptional regulator